MKTIVLLFFVLLISPSVFAARTCKDYITNEWPDGRYYVENLSGDYVVTDRKTGLMWKRCSEGLTGADCGSGSVSSLFWQESLVMTDDFAGFSDWRLPNIEELRSLLALNCFSPTINETIFPNTPSARYWSSSPIADNEFDAWVVYFDYRSDHSRGFRSYVRLVRSIQ